MKWTADRIADQSGRVAIVTGANAGIGYETARVLAQKGATVVMACRHQGRADQAAEKIKSLDYGGSIKVLLLDLSSLASVRSFADTFVGKYDRLDLLINNAGVMVPPQAKTADGFELQIGVNFLGHFALTGLLLEILTATRRARVVTISSLAHRGARIELGSFRGPDRYKAWREYKQSKLACLMFALELQRRLDAHDQSILSVAAHPGGTKTDLQRHHGLLNTLASLGAMSAAKGALSTLYAATEPGIAGGAYIGPNGLYEAWGYPGQAKIDKAALDLTSRQRLWQAAQEHTGVSYLPE